MGKKWTEKEKEYLRNGFNDGVPDDVMASILGRTHNSIKVMRRKMNITGDHNARRLSAKARAGMAKKRKGSESHSWKGGRRVTTNGYIEIHMPKHHRARGNGYVFEHIVVAEEKIGRTLDAGECVHHVDDDKTNNSPENIIVIERASHSAQHARLRSKKTKLICCVCNSEFWVKQSHINRRKTCSKSCAAKITLWRSIYVDQ